MFPQRKWSYYQKRRKGSQKQLVSTGALFLQGTDKEAQAGEVRRLLPAASGLVGRGRSAFGPQPEGEKD